MGHRGNVAEKREIVNLCRGCKWLREGDFCALLPWNDARFETAWEKYFDRHCHFCERITDQELDYAARSAQAH